MELALLWQSRYARHTDQLYFERVSLWRDMFPGDLAARLARADPGQIVSCPTPIGALVEPYDRSLVRMLRRNQFRPPRPELAGLLPLAGRFYPRHFVHDVHDFFPEDRRPLRCLITTTDHMAADFNHPFAGFNAAVEGRIIQDLEAKEERGGHCNDVPVEITADGPGMQAALADRDTDFFAGDPFARIDPRPDPDFYQQPRLVQHLDDVALAGVRQIYGEYIRPDMRVLDLMSSWVSHLPESRDHTEVTGLGLNREELERNPDLSERVVHDLNASPQLPFEVATFDAAICTVSVEYLTRPLEVFREVARVLRPGGTFIVTFSDRWFPPKVISLWTELHPFERVGLVIDYFRLSGGFVDIASLSRRGWPRPAADTHAAQRVKSDPVFAVSGVRRSDSPV